MTNGSLAEWLSDVRFPASPEGIEMAKKFCEWGPKIK